MSYSEDSSRIAEQFKKYFQEYNRAKTRDLMNIYESFWFGDYYTPREKDSIMTAGNILANTRMSNFPGLASFFKVIARFAENKYDKQQFFTWMNGIIQIVKNRDLRHSNIQVIIENSVDWMQGRYLYKRRKNKWHAEADTFYFRFDKNVFVELKEADLTCYTLVDSMQIIDATGKYNMETKKWKGEAGKITWEQSGFSPDSVYVELGDYKINMKWAELKDTESTLFHKAYFPEGIAGKVENKVVGKGRSERFPVFSSHSSDLTIKDIAPNINYSGGIKLMSDNLEGVNHLEDESVSLNVMKDGMNRMNIKTKYVDFDSVRIRSRHSTVNIYFAGDSIFHPDVRFSYYLKDSLIELYNPVRGNMELLYTDSYHGYDFNAEKIEWKVDQPVLNLSSVGLGIEKSVMFRSSNYFEPAKYSQINIPGETNAFYTLQEFAKNAIGDDPAGKFFTLQKFAQALGVYIPSAEQLLMKLQSMGFVHYQKEEKRGAFTERFFEYYKYLKGEKDFDNIQFYSRVELSKNKNTSDTTKNTSDTISSSKIPEKQKNKQKKSGKNFGKISDYSLPDTTCAKINLNTSRLNIFGVDSIPVTSIIENIDKDSKEKSKTLKERVKKETSEPSKGNNISISPANKTLSVLDGKNFEFDGKINLGNFIFVGQDFKFNYDSFAIQVDNVEYLKAKFDAGSDTTVEVDNRIENLTGNIRLNDPDNKSGREAHPRYPIFNSRDSSYVYYSDSTKHEITYARDSFYFRIAPYTIDSMNRISTKDLTLDGTFVSGGIMPNIDDSLEIMRDTNYVKPGSTEPRVAHSFGFKKNAEEKGVPIYSDKATLRKRLRLSIKGLVANGNFRYRNATVISNDFEFEEDKMTAQARKFSIDRKKGNKNFPLISGNNISVKWLPAQDTLLASSVMLDSLGKRKYQLSQTESFKDIKEKSNSSIQYLNQDDSLQNPSLHFYEDVMSSGYIDYRGKLVMTPDTLTGAGGLELNSAEMLSNSFEFQIDKFSSENIRLFTIGTRFKTTGVSGNVDLNNNITRLKSRKKRSDAEFSANEYKSAFSDYEWDMNNKTIAMRLKDSVSNNEYGTEFVSTKSDQDSLRFRGLTADLDLKNSVMDITGVKKIPVADALIYPSTAVTIRKNADMKLLSETRIETSNNNTQHEFFAADAKIESRNKFIGNGNYKYVDKTDSATIFHFDTLYTRYEIPPEDSSDQVKAPFTYGEANLNKEKQMRLSPNYKFYGGITLESYQKFLRFNGYTKINRVCDTSSYFRFATVINPEDINIPVKANLKDDKGKEAGKGFYYKTQPEKNLYASFFNETKPYTKNALIETDGLLRFDEKNNVYTIASKEKFDNQQIEGNMLSLKKDNCRVIGQGKINFHLKSQGVDLFSSGNIVNNIKNDQMGIKVMLGVDFHINDEGMEFVRSRIMDKRELKSFKPTNEFFTRQLEQVMSRGAKASFMGALETGETTVPDKFAEYEIVFAAVNFRWDMMNAAYVSEGPLNIAFIGGEPVFRQVAGTITIEKKGSNDIFNIDLNIGEDDWYFFRFRGGKLQTIASNDTYNKIIEDTWFWKQRKDGFEFLIGERNTRSRFNRAYASERTSSSAGEFDFSTTVEEEDDDEYRRTIVGPTEDSTKTAKPDSTSELPPDTTSTEEGGSGEVIYGGSSTESEEETKSAPDTTETKESSSSGIFEEEDE